MVVRLRKIIDEARKSLDETIDDLKKQPILRDRFENLQNIITNIREKFLDSAEDLGIDIRSRQDMYLKDFNDLLDLLGLEPPYPRFEIFEDQSFNFLRVILDLPGFTKQDIELECAPKKLRVKGKANITKTEVREVNKIINLPEIVNPQSAKATLENGILKIELSIVK